MPKLSIGLPVYNGERFLPEQVESLLGQTFTDFELLIVDNASTDSTPEICRAFSARDRRVRYHRNERNIGGGPNQNLAYQLSAPSPYFKWAAHDDVHGPKFLEQCVTALDQDPGAVLAFTKAEVIGDDGKSFEKRSLELPLGNPDVLVRFESLLMTYDCMEMFGVMRRSAIAGPPIGLYVNGDGVFLIRMALRGRFLEIPEVSFFNRRHGGQTMTLFARDAHAWAAWWNPANAGRRVFPTWRRIAEVWKSLLAAPLPPRERLRCLAVLARFTRWRRHRLYDDLAYHFKDVTGPLRRRRREDTDVAPP